MESVSLEVKKAAFAEALLRPDQYAPTIGTQENIALQNRIAQTLTRCTSENVQV